MMPAGERAAPPAPDFRGVAFLLRKPVTARRAASTIASFTVAATIVAGVLIRFTDRPEFPNIGDGLWWAVQTVTTVGYGDHVPTSIEGRLVAALVMVGGLGFLTVITATITSILLENARVSVEGEADASLDAKLDAIGVRLKTIEASLEDLSARDSDARR